MKMHDHSTVNVLFHLRTSLYVSDDVLGASVCNLFRKLRNYQFVVKKCMRRNRCLLDGKQLNETTCLYDSHA